MWLLSAISGRHLHGYQDKEFFKEEVSFADSNVFKVFDYEWIEGDPETALTEPKSIVLAGLIMLIITGITVSYHTIRSANVNPAESLKYE